MGIQENSMKVIYYDKYYDIPIRGIIDSTGSLFPFIAEVNNEADESSWRSGIPTKLVRFSSLPELIVDYEFITKAFNIWKNRQTSIGHPILTDPVYKSAIERIDASFRNFHEKGQISVGLFSNNGTEWCFNPK